MDDRELRQLVAALEEAVGRVEAKARSVPPDRWDDVIHTGDGAWSRRKLLAHMAANDLRQLVRIRIGAGIPEAGDPAEHEAELQVHEWNEARVQERLDRDIDGLLQEMRRNRAALVRLVAGLTAEQRGRPMPFRGVPTPLAEMIRVVIAHLDGHADELIA